MQNVNQTVISQYGNSPIILAMVENFNEVIDPTADINAFYSNVWNIQTAQGFGLDIWGRIVGVTRYLNVSGGVDFGYKEAAGQPFGQAAYYFGVAPSSNYSLPDTIFRQLILVKALSNISDCSIKTYNKILMQLFPGRGNAFASDTGNMSMILSLNFALYPFEVAILKQSGAFSNPAGVNLSIAILQNTVNFGFAEAGAAAAPFNNGIFFKGFA